MGRIAIAYRNSLLTVTCGTVRTSGINLAFARLSPGMRQVRYALRTRAPVAIISIATHMLPLDLHVLSLPLAFILSQDQTLHCKIYLFFLFWIIRTRLASVKKNGTDLLKLYVIISTGSSIYPERQPNIGHKKTSRQTAALLISCTSLANKVYGISIQRSLLTGRTTL